MRSRGCGRLRSWIEKYRNSTREISEEAPHQGPHIQEIALANPVDAYYRHKAQNHLPVFYRFAVQSRSTAVRDVFAKASSTKNLDLGDLLNVIQNLPSYLSGDIKRSLATKFDFSVLTTLADLLANTARDDLETRAAVRLYDFVYSLFGMAQFSNQQKLLYIEALHEARYFDRSERLAREHSIGEIAPLQPELLALQRIRRTSPALTSEWIQRLNNLYSALGMTKVRLLDDETLSPLDRLTAEIVTPVEGPKVSIIMPTFCPGEGIRTAIRGLLEQTWQNFEIIVVDDASPDEYQQVFTELSQLDHRIRLIHQERNAGAYVARNVGLSNATGDFITTADDDDWSHPDKIASQVSVMLENPQTVASISAHIRTDEQLELQRVNSSARFLQTNYSSLMFRREVIEEIGGWDTVNRGGDSEFLMRLRKFYGSDKVTQIRDQPLAFSRVWNGSLTSGEMYRGFTATPRQLHIWAIRQWHWDLESLNQKPTRSSNSARPYSVPSTFEAGQRHKNLGLFDVIYVTDFFRNAKYVDHVLKEMATLGSRGFRVGYAHLDSPRTTKTAGLPRVLLESQFAGKIIQVSLEDVAETRLLIVYDSAVGMFTDQTGSRITSRRSVLVERELPFLSGAPERLPTSPAQALSHLDRTFDSYFEIVGASKRDQERVAASVPPSRLLPDSFIWRTHVDRPAVEIRPPIGKPVVGFHSYGNKYRWPHNKQVFRDVYISNLYETHFSGQLAPAFKKFGKEAFNTSRLFDYADTPTRDFLKGVDFWVYYPEPKLHDDVWEPALMAMRAGKVVILPPSLETVYRHGAIYGQPDEVGEIISDLSSNIQAFERQARLGQSFVDDLFSTEAFYDRVSRLLEEVS